MADSRKEKRKQQKFQALKNGKPQQHDEKQQLLIEDVHQERLWLNVEQLSEEELLQWVEVLVLV